MNLQQGNTLSKQERLYCKKDIGNLLAEGRFASVGILRFCSIPNGLEYSRIMVSVPKKNFKRAVKRNLLKRRIRESYRIQKNTLLKGSDILFIYTPKEILSFEEIDDSVMKVIAKINQEA